MNPIQTTCPVCEYDRAYISNGKLRCRCGYEADTSPLQSKPMTKPQPERISLTPEQYANLSSFEVSCRNMEEILDDVSGFGELPLDALKRVIQEYHEAREERDKLKAQTAKDREHMTEATVRLSAIGEERDELKAYLLKLQKIISAAHDPFTTYLDAETALVGIVEERDQLKSEADRLNTRFVEAQKEWKQPPLPREVGYAHSMLCQALQSIVGGNGRTGAQRVNSARQALEDLIFNWQERMEVKGE